MIKLFVAVDLHSEHDEPQPHTFCFNYGSSNFDNFVRATQDYLNNHPWARYIELNVDGKPLYGEDIVRAFSSSDPSQLKNLFFQYREDSLETVNFPLEKTA